MQPCNTARLLTAIFEIPLAESFTAVGLECCPCCGKPSTNPAHYPYCNPVCFRRFERRPVQLLCEECGVLFTRVYRVVMQTSRAGYQRTWCGHKCQGKWLARAHGFGTRPEDTGRKRGGGRKKMVEEKQS